MRQFVKVGENNPKVFMEALFWKSSRDAFDIEHGYGSYKEKCVPYFVMLHAFISFIRASDLCENRRGVASNLELSFESAIFSDVQYRKLHRGKRCFDLGFCLR